MIFKNKIKEIEEENPICQLCGDNCFPKLSKRGWCKYCEIGYEKGKENTLKQALEKIEECKIHTFGALILIEKKDLLKSLEEME